MPAINNAGMFVALRALPGGYNIRSLIHIEIEKLERRKIGHIPIKGSDEVFGVLLHPENRVFQSKLGVRRVPQEALFSVAKRRMFTETTSDVNLNRAQARI